MLTRTTVVMGTVVIAVGMLGAVAAPAGAQESRLRVSIGAAATAGTGPSQPALVGSVGYRFANRLVFDIEVTGFEASDGRFSDLPFSVANLGGPGGAGGVRGADLLPFSGAAGRVLNGIGLNIGARGGPQGLATTILPPVRANVDGNTMIGTLGFRYEFPVQTGRLTPYVTAGFGAARTERTFEYSVQPLQAGQPPRGGVMTNTTRAGNESMSHTGIAASLGVGASLRVFKQLSVDVDARYFRLGRDRDLGRIGGGLSYRF